MAERCIFMNNQRKKLLQKMEDTLKIGGKSEKTILNYSCAIKRFYTFFEKKDISKLNEEDILEYIKKNYLNKACSSNTYNMNICAIKYFYSVNFNIDLNSKLLPHSKLAKKIPKTLDKHTFIKILNDEKNLKHKCWLLLGYCSGLRVEEVAQVKIEDIFSSEHRLKVFGKRKKERYTLLADITIKYLRLFFLDYYLQRSKPFKKTSGFLFEGQNKTKPINSKTITNYFIKLKKKHNLDKNIVFHSLRHSFSSNFIKAGGDPFVLKAMLGHSSMNSTSIYIHMGRDFNNLKGVKYVKL